MWSMAILWDIQTWRHDRDGKVCPTPPPLRLCLYVAGEDLDTGLCNVKGHALILWQVADGLRLSRCFPAVVVQGRHELSN